MHANPSPRLPPALHVQVPYKYFLIQQVTNFYKQAHGANVARERESDVPANEDCANCDDEVNCTSISESAGDSNTTSLSPTFLNCCNSTASSQVNNAEEVEHFRSNYSRVSLCKYQSCTIIGLASTRLD